MNLRSFRVLFAAAGLSAFTCVLPSADVVDELPGRTGAGGSSNSSGVGGKGAGVGGSGTGVGGGGAGEAGGETGVGGGTSSGVGGGEPGVGGGGAGEGGAGEDLTLLVPGCTNCNFPNGIPSTIADFELDKYEVTVGRFRKFVEAYSGRPALGAGAHPLIEDSGWRSDWDAFISATQVDLANKMQSQNCDEVPIRTWTPTAGDNEQKPINCLNWYQAFAFCAWDGGFLPTEVEWQYAAAGGEDNRMFPWNSDAIGAENAVYGYCDNGVTSECPISNIPDVGSKPDGAGKWGHLDLVGSMWEWVLDTVDGASFPVENPCDNCASLFGSGDRMIRGGSWFEDSTFMANTFRGASDAGETVWYNVGVRCAREP